MIIPITKPFLPPKEEYNTYLEGIWKRNWLTNNGPLVNELELELKKLLKLKHLLFVNNGTTALQIAINALELKGEVITTPFSYVATTSSLVWEKCIPIFVDIDSNTLNIDPNKIEVAITSKTTGIIATHVYGNSCDIDAIQSIANKYHLKVIYDAAHAFGVQYKSHSIFEFGDISATSFHATKIFHTIEGGAVITKDANLLKKMSSLRNFGHNGPEQFAGIGINGKNSELHAAMGLCNLKYIKEILSRQKYLCMYYDQRLKNLEVTRPQIVDPDNYNYAYYPILFRDEATLLKTKAVLDRTKIFSRRYFYPTLSSLNYVKKQATPIADSIAQKVLCLPLYFEISKEEIDYICRILLRVQNYQ